MNSSPRFASRPPARLLLSSFVFLPLLLISLGCADRYQHRKPRLANPPGEQDEILLHRPVNSIDGDGPTLQECFLMSKEKRAGILVRSFPEAPALLQRALAAVLTKRFPVARVPEHLKPAFPIPYSYPRRTSPDLNVEPTDRITFNETPEDLSRERFGPEASVIVTGRINDMAFGYDEAVRAHLDERIPPGNALLRIHTSWTVGFRTNNRVRMKKFHVRDRAVVNLNRYAVRPMGAYYSAEKAVTLLLQRVAWKVATRFMPYRYDTEVQSGSNETND